MRTIAAIVLLGFGLATDAQAASIATADVIVHDPVLIKQNDTWYLYGTGQGIAVHSSKDLRQWTAEPPVFKDIPAWTYSIAADFKGHIWAPDISLHDGVYTLYYSISSGGKNTSAIGVATNTTLDPRAPGYRWVDRGIVVQSVPYRDLWNAIDPNLVVDDKGSAWFSFGSFWSGLKLFKLSADRTRPAEPQQWHSIAKRERSVLVDDKEPEPASIEAPFIFRKHGYYYLFASWDYCCRGIKSDYKIVVGRAKNVEGPYLDKTGKDMNQGGGSLLLKGNARWPGVGHNSAYTFDGKDYLVFHAYDAKDDGKPKLKILDLRWDAAGWPVVDERALED